MNQQQSQQMFQQADVLFRQGNYPQALQLLNQLNTAFPNSQNILYPAALCLEKLGRTQEAMGVCRQLTQQFQDPRAQKIMARLAASQSPVESGSAIPGAMAGGGGVDGIELDMNPLAGLLDDDDLRPGGSRPPAPPVYTGGGGMSDYLKIGGIIAAFLAFGGFLKSLANTEVESVEVLVALIIVGITYYILLSFATGVLSSYFALKILGGLPHDDFWEDIKTLSIWTLVTVLVCIIPIIGWIYAIYYWCQKLDLGCGGYFVFALLSAVVGIPISMTVWLLTLPFTIFFSVLL